MVNFPTIMHQHLHYTGGGGLLDVKLGMLVLLEFEKPPSFQKSLNMKSIPIHILKVRKLYPFIPVYSKYENYTHSYIIQLLVTHSYIMLK